MQLINMGQLEHEHEHFAASITVLTALAPHFLATLV